MSVKMGWFHVVFISLCVFKGTWPFQWTSDHSDVINLSSGQDLHLPVTYTLAQGEQVADIQWYFRGQSEEMVAMVNSHGQFVPMTSFANRVEFVPPAGIVVKNVVPSDSGNYTVEVTSHTGPNSFSVQRLTVVVHVTGAEGGNCLLPDHDQCAILPDVCQDASLSHLLCPRVCGFCASAMTTGTPQPTTTLPPTTATPSPTTATQTPKPGPCADGNHTVLDDAWREVNQRGVSYCDNYLPAGWYRFLLHGHNAVIPTSCVAFAHCFTSSPIWLDLEGKPMPDLGQQTTGRAYGSAADDMHTSNTAFCRKYQKTPVTVLNCGAFYVYHLMPATICYSAYCATVSN